MDEKTLNYVDAIVRSASLDESDFSDDDVSAATTTTENNVVNNAKELENAFKIHALWSVQLNAILETLSETDLEDEMASLIETAEERNRKKQNDGATAFLPAVLTIQTKSHSVPRERMRSPPVLHRLARRRRRRRRRRNIVTRKKLLYE